MDKLFKIESYLTVKGVLEKIQELLTRVLVSTDECPGKQSEGLHGCRCFAKGEKLLGSTLQSKVRGQPVFVTLKRIAL